MGYYRQRKPLLAQQAIDPRSFGLKKTLVGLSSFISDSREVISPKPVAKVRPSLSRTKSMHTLRCELEPVVHFLNVRKEQLVSSCTQGATWKKNQSLLKIHLPARETTIWFSSCVIRLIMGVCIMLLCHFICCIEPSFTISMSCGGMRSES